MFLISVFVLMTHSQSYILYTIHYILCTNLNQNEKIWIIFLLFVIKMVMPHIKWQTKTKIEWMNRVESLNEWHEEQPRTTQLIFAIIIKILTTCVFRSSLVSMRVLCVGETCRKKDEHRISSFWPLLFWWHFFSFFPFYTNKSRWFEN